MSAAKDYTDGWSTGIWDCCNDGRACVKTFFWPCATYANNVSSLQEEQEFGSNCVIYCGMAVIGCTCLAYKQRFFLRQKYGLPEEPCTDCCTHFWCHHLALCQEAREIKIRNALVSS
ncbi:hypothetical protein BSKO_05569 [Bryopsis sp. KO-2023]|nr:hypothetical protein BSKO_05569 [Bryopsis sp. KO-2023]